MITQTVDPHHFIRRARQIKAQIPMILSQWGLLPRFKRWRLAQDPQTGMVVLFGELNNKYIATHTSTPFSDYFDPRLLHDLATGLHVQVISSANDGLRYAFVLEKGKLGNSTEIEEIDPPAIARPHEQIVVDQARTQSNLSTLTEEHTLLHQRLARFLKISLLLNEERNSVMKPMPDVLLLDEAEFNQLMTDYEGNLLNYSNKMS